MTSATSVPRAALRTRWSGRPPRLPSPRRDRLTAVAARLVVLGIFIGIWQLWASNSTSLLIPTFSATASSLWSQAVTHHTIWNPFWRSNEAILVGYPVAAATAIPVGLAMARWPRFGRFMNPYAAIMLSIPLAPLLPLLLIAFGTGLLPRVAVVIMFCWVFIALNARAGVRAVDPNLTEMARSLGASEAQIWRKVLVVGGMPGILVGLRAGLARALAGMITAELLLIAAGIGGLLLEAQGLFQADRVFAVVLAVIIESVTLMAIARRLEARLVRWNQ